MAGRTVKRLPARPNLPARGNPTPPRGRPLIGRQVAVKLVVDLAFGLPTTACIVWTILAYLRP